MVAARGTLEVIFPTSEREISLRLSDSIKFWPSTLRNSTRLSRAGDERPPYSNLVCVLESPPPTTQNPTPSTRIQVERTFSSRHALKRYHCALSSQTGQRQPFQAIWGGGGESLDGPTDKQDDHAPSGEISRADSPGDMAIDSDDEANSATRFESEKHLWIGTGKVWSAILPDWVKDACHRAQGMPCGIMTGLLPSPESNIIRALRSATHVRRSSGSRQAMYSADAPTAHSLDKLHLDQLIRALPCLPHLRQTINSAWLLGMQSVQMEPLPHSYPLWIIQVLSNVHTFLDRRNQWQGAVEWVQSCQINPRTQDNAETCMDIIESLPWDSAVPGFGSEAYLTTQDLALLLGDGWLNDDLINAGVESIRRCLPVDSRVAFANCLLVQALAGACASSSGYHAHSLLDRQIENGLVDVVWFPLHVSGNHWTLLRIDLNARTLELGDSLHQGSRNKDSTPDEVGVIHWWLRLLRPGPEFTVVQSFFTRNFPHQDDTHSCGVVVLSTLRHTLLGDDTWTWQDADLHRLRWFERLTETFAPQLPPPSRGSPPAGYLLGTLRRLAEGTQ
ncbi:unnamed protein product [Mycena citricolor]|uniref:Ubiquitin-like protease family profile domain-containing protein n=1 Tax=Mycena citricolor TaxID=2018698 RepID=A0AAD2HRP4_9AGAR|nr:unnamed protein product [Mycena citricolor]